MFLRDNGCNYNRETLNKSSLVHVRLRKMENTCSEDKTCWEQTDTLLTNS
jgi:hypothetical protein